MRKFLSGERGSRIRVGEERCEINLNMCAAKTSGPAISGNRYSIGRASSTNDRGPSIKDNKKTHKDTITFSKIQNILRHGFGICV